MRPKETKVNGKGQTCHDLDKDLMSLVERFSKHLPTDKIENRRCKPQKLFGEIEQEVHAAFRRYRYKMYQQGEVRND